MGDSHLRTTFFAALLAAAYFQFFAFGETCALYASGRKVVKAIRMIGLGYSRVIGYLMVLLLWIPQLNYGQDFSIHTLQDGNGYTIPTYLQTTGLSFGPDGRLYVLSLKGQILVLDIERNVSGDYEILQMEELLQVKSIPNHNDDGTTFKGNDREATGIAVAGTAANPVVYVASSDARVGGPSGDKNLDTNSGVITRLSWNGTGWETVDIVRGLPRSEENHATNDLEFLAVNGKEYLVVASGGNTNAGSPSTNFAWHTEYALASAVLIVDLTALNAMPVLNDGARDYIYDLPTLDDPTRENANGIEDPAHPDYDGIDINDPWGGNDGLNQAKLVKDGPVQILSPGYRNTYGLVVTESGALYVTDNGANAGWGGFPENEGIDGTVTNNYRPGEPGSSSADNGEAKVNNKDHVSLVTTDLSSYVWGSFYAGHPVPVRANPFGAGLFTRGAHSSDPGDVNGNGYTDDWFRTIPYNPNGTGEAADPQRALPADWPPVPVDLADPRQGDFRNPGDDNPDGTNDILLTLLPNNSNAIDEYTASNFNGAMKGDLIVGKNGGVLHRIELEADGSLKNLTTNFVTGLQNNLLGVSCNSDTDPFPGTIWLGNLGDIIYVLEPQDFSDCQVEPGDPDYDSPLLDSDGDGYTNQDEVDNGTDVCRATSKPNDFDGDLVSDLNDKDDDNDGLLDSDDPFQLGQAFDLPVINDLLSEATLGGYFNLGFTGFMNNGDTAANWVGWTDKIGPNGESLGPNPNDLLGGAIGGITQQMTEGTARGTSNDQEKGLQFGVNVDTSTGPFTVEARMDNFNQPLQLFGGNTTNGEMGIFLGDGTQSNYLQFVATPAGLKMMMEVNDQQVEVLSAPYPIPTADISNIDFRFWIDPTAGTIEGTYRFNSTSVADPQRYSIGAVTAQGAILAALQQHDLPLAVGFIGTSNEVGKEVESTWAFLYVRTDVPSLVTALPNVEGRVNDPAYTDDLAQYFTDNDGTENLTFSVEANSDPSVRVFISGTNLQIDFPADPTTATVTIRATDANGSFAEAQFEVRVSNDLQVFYRVNAGGPEVASIDGKMNWERDERYQPSAYLVYPDDSKTTGFEMLGYDPGVDLSRVPSSVFASERWDGESEPEMQYAFPVENGTYQVNLYIGDGFSLTDQAGDRIFSIELEGTVPSTFDQVDPVGLFGHLIGGMISSTVEVTDDTLNLRFLHGPIENPLINAIEICGGATGGRGNPIAVEPLPDQKNYLGESLPGNLVVIATGGDGNLVYRATGLPPGVEIEPTNGNIYGTISETASIQTPYPVVVTVDDEDADSSDWVSISFEWTILEMPIWIDLGESEQYTGRHECSFVQAGNEFILMGGRESDIPEHYAFGENSWSQGTPPPVEFNHFQAIEYQGLVWVIGAFKTNNFPDELPAENVWIYDPVAKDWLQGPEIPVERRRGSAGLVLYNDKFYVLGGNTQGHNGGYVPWLDVFDPHTGEWTTLADAPHARDHFHAVVVDGKLFAIGGRLSGGEGGTFAPLVPEVDVYDLSTGYWMENGAYPDLPTPRAAPGVAYFQNEIFVMGGETSDQSDAFDLVEALDPVAKSWSVKAPMNYPRHGTQAIVSGDGIFMISGSPQRGGGNQKNLEVYHTNNPQGADILKGALQAPDSVVFSTSRSEMVPLLHNGGNQAIMITGIELVGTDKTDFLLPNGQNYLYLAPGASLEIPVEYEGSAGNAMAALLISYGLSDQRSIALTARLVRPPSVTINGPSEGAILMDCDKDGSLLSLSGTGRSFDGADLSDQIQWESDIDGPLGQGADLEVYVSPGEHLLTAKLWDGLQVDSQSVRIKVTSGPSINVSQPLEGSTVLGNEVQVCWDADLNMDISDHVHVMLDGRNLNGDPGHSSIYEANTCVTFTNIAPGPHTLMLVPATQNHVLYCNTYVIHFEVELPTELAFAPGAMATAVSVHEKTEMAFSVHTNNGVQLDGPLSVRLIDNATQAPPIWATTVEQAEQGVNYPIYLDASQLLPGEYSATLIAEAENEALSAFTTVTLSVGAIPYRSGDPHREWLDRAGDWGTIRSPAKPADSAPSASSRSGDTKEGLLTEPDLTFHLYPNPVKDHLRLQFDQRLTEDASLRVFDLTGRLLFQRSVPRGTDFLEVAVSGLEAGTYLLRIVGNNHSGLATFVKMQ